MRDWFWMRWQYVQFWWYGPSVTDKRLRKAMLYGIITPREAYQAQRKNNAKSCARS